MARRRSEELTTTSIIQALGVQKDMAEDIFQKSFNFTYDTAGYGNETPSKIWH